MIKKTILLTMFVMAALVCTAQQRTTQATLYKQFKPSVITLKTGRTINQSHTNVFLKNGSLVYLNGEYTMEANMETIAAVEFDDRKFININNQLAYMVDSVGSNILYRIDLLDLNSEDDYKLPIFSHYYFFYNGEFVKVHERDISRVLPKDKDLKRKYRTIIGMDDFSWNSDNSLMKLLKAITVKEGEQ